MATASHPVMEQQQAPGAEQNMKAKLPKIILGLALAIGISILMVRFLSYINQSCCGLGYLMIACVALYVPKMFGLSKTKYLAIFGVALFIILAIAGTFVYWKPTVEDNSDYTKYDNNGFNSVDIVYDNGNLTITVSYSGTGEVTANLYKVLETSTKKSTSPMTKTSTGYSCTFSNVERNYIYQYNFEALDGDKKTVSSTSYYIGIVDDSVITKICFVYSLVNTLTIIAVYYLMLILTAIMRRNLEKTRARMEAEGRLYPQGYGRCKECGSIVLPGETCCRKCGAYIDVPDELRHKKVDMVQCSECGAEIPEDATVCPKCGAKFDEDEEIVYVDSESDEKMQCSDCGSVIPADATVCPKCGAKFDEDDGTTDTEEKKD